MDIHVDKSTTRDGSEVWSFPLVGSTFRSSDGKSRQAVLRYARKKQDAFWDDMDSDCSVLVDLERYTYDGAPAYRVYFDDREAGNVPASVAADLAELEDAGYTVWGDDCEVYGGPTPEFPDKHYGARLYIKVRKPPNPSCPAAPDHPDADPCPDLGPTVSHPSARPADTPDEIRARGRRTRRCILLGVLILCVVFYLLVAVIPDIIYSLYW